MHIIPNQNHNVKPSHKELIKNHLLAGKTITQADFCQMTTLGSRLAPRILNLKQDGHPIYDKNKGKKSADGADKFSRYALPQYSLNNVANYGLENALRGEMMAKGA